MLKGNEWKELGEDKKEAIWKYIETMTEISSCSSSEHITDNSMKDDLHLSDN